MDPTVGGWFRDCRSGRCLSQRPDLGKVEKALRIRLAGSPVLKSPAMIVVRGPPLARSGFPLPRHRPACDPTKPFSRPHEVLPSIYSLSDCQYALVRSPRERSLAVHLARPVLAAE